MFTYWGVTCFWILFVGWSGLRVVHLENDLDVLNSQVETWFGGEPWSLLEELSPGMHQACARHAPIWRVRIKRIFETTNQQLLASGSKHDKRIFKIYVLSALAAFTSFKKLNGGCMKESQHIVLIWFGASFFCMAHWSLYIPPIIYSIFHLYIHCGWFYTPPLSLVLGGYRRINDHCLVGPSHPILVESSPFVMA